MENLYIFVLFLTNTPFILSLIAFGYINISAKLFGKALMLILLAIITSFFLKEFFRIAPLENHLGWSFPSGHALVSASLWIYISFKTRNWLLTIFTLTLLLLIPFALSHHKHHYVDDAIASYFYAVCLIGIFCSIDSNFYRLSNFIRISSMVLFSILISIISLVGYNNIFITSVTLSLLIFHLGYTLFPFPNTSDLSPYNKAKLNFMCGLLLLFIYLIYYFYNIEIYSSLIKALTFPLTILVLAYFSPIYAGRLINKEKARI